jgi:uncharacterized protein
MNQSRNIERRIIGAGPSRLRASSVSAGNRIIGHAAVFNSPAQICPSFREQVAPGAFADSIRNDDVRALFNHDANFVLGRNTAGTLRMREDGIGLAIEVDPPDAQWVQDLMASIGRGDITQMSFGFCAIEESWSELPSGMALRTLRKVQLFDVSPVTYPAYDDTDVSLADVAQPGRSRLIVDPAGYAAAVAAGHRVRALQLAIAEGELKR